MKNFFSILSLLLAVSAPIKTYADTEIASIENDSPKTSQSTEIHEEKQGTPTEEVSATTQKETTIQPIDTTSNQPTETTQQSDNSSDSKNGALLQIQDQPISKDERVIKEMLARNPFAESRTSASENNPDNANIEVVPDGLELRGISCIDGKWTFFIHDTRAKLDYRIGLKQSLSEKTPYVVDFYDDETNSISVSNNITTFTLTLKTPDAPTGKAPSAAKSSASKQPAKTATKAKK